MSSDCDMPVCCVERHPVARIRHRCCECGGVIEPGTRYHYFSGVWDDRGQSFKTCPACRALTENWRAELRSDGLRDDWMLAIGELFADLMESRADNFLDSELDRLDKQGAWVLAAAIRRHLGDPSVTVGQYDDRSGEFGFGTPNHGLEYRFSDGWRLRRGTSTHHFTPVLYAIDTDNTHFTVLDPHRRHIRPARLSDHVWRLRKKF